jgi:antitoxin MazE
VRLTLRDRQLVIEALVQEPLNLDALLAQVTAENLHREVDTGPSVGGEVW